MRFFRLLTFLLAVQAAHAQLFTRAHGESALEPLDAFERWYQGDAQFFTDSSGDQYYAVSRYLSCRPTADDEWRIVAYESDMRFGEFFAGPVGDAALFAVPKRFEERWNLQIWTADCSAVYDALPDTPLGLPSEGTRPLESRPAWRNLPAGINAFPFGRAFALDGDWCVGGMRQAVWCLDDAGETFEIVFDADRLPEQIPGAVEAMSSFVADLGFDLADTAEPPQTALRAHLTLPDGRVAALATWTQIYAACSPDGENCFNLSFQLHWVVHLRRDGRAEVLFGPMHRYDDLGPNATRVPTTDPPQVLGVDLDELHYDPVWDALWVGPVQGWNHSTRPAGEYDCDIGVPSELGPVGGGYRIVPLDGAGSGYLDLSEAVVEVLVPQEITGPVDMGPARCKRCVVRFRGVGGSEALVGGDLVLEVDGSRPNGENGPWMYRVHVDRDGVDLDSDTLTAAEEARLGTSDLDADSDDDGVTDGMEHRAGRDPAVADPPAHAFPVALVPSLLLFQLDADLGEGRIDANRYEFPISQNPVMKAGTPTCLWLGGGAAGCVSADGRVLAEWIPDAPNRVEPPGYVSADGRVAAVPMRDGVHRVDLETGADTVWLSQATLNLLWPAAPTAANDAVTAHGLFLFPVSADALLVYPRALPSTAAEHTYRLIRVDADGDPEVVLDMDAEIAASDAGGALTAGPVDLCAQRLDVRPWVRTGLGFHAASGRVLLGMSGNWDSYLVGLHPDDPAQVMQTTRTLLHREVDDYAAWPPTFGFRPFPDFFSPTADGGYFTGTSVLGPHLDHVPVNPWTYRMLTHAVAGISGQYPHAVTQTWTHCGHAQLDHLGIEWLALERRVNPGDTLLMGYGNNPNRHGLDGVMLWSIGPRGGANPLWERGRTDIVQATGIDLADDGTLCVADRGGQQLLELAPLGDGSRIPATEIRRETGLDVIDCYYDGDDLALLLGAPLRVEVIDRATGERSLVEELTPPAPDQIAADLLDNGDGTYSVLWLEPGEGGLRGGTVLADGTLHAYLNGSLGDEFDRPITLSGESLYRAVQRPDGNVIAVFSSAAAPPRPADRLESEALGREPMHVTITDDREVFHAATVLTGYFEGTFGGGHGPFTLAQVPGGEAVDPWTAEPDRACWEVEPLGAADAGPDPDGGVGDAGPNDGATADGDDGCGCRAHESGTDVPWWSLLLMVLRRRRAAS